ncbi:MAG: DnaA regulatory inactivator Hda [Gammaproteobacteria bacterium]|nr:DnaA regulatory inactivator Hda [Gammaproteobacteria bacterium]
MNHQLPLGITLRDTAAFENYFSGSNSEVTYALQQCAEGKGEQFIYLWGASGTGKSHLLQAVCKAIGGAVYLPLSETESMMPEMLDGLENMDVVCIDDIDNIEGDDIWETQIFNLFNRIRESGNRLIVSGNAKPADLKIKLPDLVSRLNWGLTLHLQRLNDNDKLSALQLRADKRGFDLPDNVGRYLLKHNTRDLASLFDLLDHLDVASLAAQRKLTIPFVKEVAGFSD